MTPAQAEVVERVRVRMREARSRKVRHLIIRRPPGRPRGRGVSPRSVRAAAMYLLADVMTMRDVAAVFGVSHQAVADAVARIRRGR